MVGDLSTYLSIWKQLGNPFGELRDLPVPDLCVPHCFDLLKLHLAENGNDNDSLWYAINNNDSMVRARISGAQNLTSMRPGHGSDDSSRINLKY